MPDPLLRDKRFYDGDRDDHRRPSQRDRDRVLYCSSFRRLAEVSQVVSASEGYSFHNRLTHTLKVGQIARRLAEKLLIDQPAVAKALGGPDPEVAETAGLAHDLGHPPFGHVAEHELNELAGAKGDRDGFNGNAQSFRIVSKLAIRSKEYPGLNLTAASLNAILKYPYFVEEKGGGSGGWGAYHTETDEFRWARDVLDLGEVRSVEAELMDWADDIAYSVFDIDDFYRSGLVPLDQIFADRAERERFQADATKRLRRIGKEPGPIIDAFEGLITNFPPLKPQGRYRGTSEQRALLREWTSYLVARYVNAIKLRVPSYKTERCVVIEPKLKNEVEGLKQLVWIYVIENPRLLTQQAGERRIIKDLFGLFLEKAKNDLDIFPHPFCDVLRNGGHGHAVRVVIDMISGMTETQAVRLHHRLGGIRLGSIHEQL